MLDLPQSCRLCVRLTVRCSRRLQACRGAELSGADVSSDDLTRSGQRGCACALATVSVRGMAFRSPDLLRRAGGATLHAGSARRGWSRRAGPMGSPPPPARHGSATIRRGAPGLPSANPRVHEVTPYGAPRHGSPLQRSEPRDVPLSVGGVRADRRAGAGCVSRTSPSLVSAARTTTPRERAPGAADDIYMHKIGYLSRGRSPPLSDEEGTVLHPFPGERSESLTRRGGPFSQRSIGGFEMASGLLKCRTQRRRLQRRAPVSCYRRPIDPTNPFRVHGQVG
jgi:hypothetical protein